MQDSYKSFPIVEPLTENPKNTTAAMPFGFLMPGEAEENSGLPDPGYEYFKEEILKLTTINLNDYKEKQMKRRIKTLIGRKNLSGYEEFVQVLQNNRRELEAFVDYMTINVTEFFRTSDHWEYFEKSTLKELIWNRHLIKCNRTQNENQPAGACLRIWSSACATGEEPYSLVMSLAEYLPLEQIRVVATDLNKNVLKQAAEGKFSNKTMENVPEDRKKKYFTETGNGWQISEKIRECVEFKRLDLLKDDFPEEQDLITCRNVLIYFTEDAKNMIYRKFFDSLAEGGYLFTGNTEQIIQYKQFGYIKEKNFLYRKPTQIEKKN